MMKVVGVCGSSWALDAYAPPAQTTNVQPLQVSTGSANPPDPCIDPYFYVKKVSGVSTLYICTDGHPQLFAGSGDGSGSAGTITVGTVTTGAPGSSVTVTNSGTSTAAILNFSIPAGAAGATGAAGAQGAAGAAGAKGDKGDTGNAGAAGSAGATGAAGAAATIAVGTVTTLSPGASATVSNAGSSSAATFNFGIPAGAAGATGATGATGAAGADGTNPFSDTTVNVSFDCAQAAGGSDVLPSFTSGHAYIYAAAISGVMNCEVHYADGTSGVIATVGKSAQNANNLSDLASASTARTNLGLGTAATTAASAYDASGAAAAVLGTSLQKASNLSDLASASTARTNLGLGTAATTATTAYDAAGAATAIKSDVAVSNVTTGAPATLTDGTTVTWTIGSAYTANSKLTFTTHGGSRTLNLSGIAAVGFYNLVLVQDATGGESLTGGTGCTWKQPGGGGTTFTLTATAAAIDIISIYYDGTNCYANLNKAFN